MEFCRRWGIAKWVEEAPYPRDYPQDNVWVTSLTGYELGREPFPSMQDELPPPQSPQKRERCPQDMFDPVLKRFASSFSDVTLRYCTELVGSKGENVKMVCSPRCAMPRLARRIPCGRTTSWAPTAGRAQCEIFWALQHEWQSGFDLHDTNVIFRCTELPLVHDRGYRFIFIGPEGVWLTIVAINGRDRWRMSIVGNAEQTTYGEFQEIRRCSSHRAAGPGFRL